MNAHYVQGNPLFTKVNKVPKQYPYLTEDEDTEVVIIGGGITAALLGYYLTKQGVKCMIVEKHRIGFGSTSVATSLLQYELDSRARQLEEYLSLEQVLQVYKLGLKALEEIDKIIQEHGNKCSYEKKGTLCYTAKEVQIGEIEEEYKIRKAGGLEVEYIGAAENPFVFDLKAGIYAPHGGAQFDPYLFTHELLEVSSNIKVYENTEVIDIKYLQDKVVVQTSYGNEVTANIAILATGYDTNKFVKRSFGTKTVSYNIATKPVKDLTKIKNIPIIRDSNEPYFYYRTTADGRIIAGGGDMPFEPNMCNEKLAEEKYTILEDRIRQMFPQIEDLEVEYKYCGCFASTSDNLGFIGKDPNHDKLWYCLGYGANGILFDVLGAMMLTQLYKGEENPDLKLFETSRFDK